MAAKVNPIPNGFSGVIPFLVVKDAVKAIEFYKKVFGAKEVGRLSAPGGRVGYSELQIGNGRLMLADEVPEWGNKGPQSLGGSPVTLCVYAENVDEVYKKAIAEGAKADPRMELQDQFYGDRAGNITDPFGHKWTIAKHIEDVSFEEMQKRFNAMLAKQKV
jgi:PhnB protein